MYTNRIYDNIVNSIKNYGSSPMADIEIKVWYETYLEPFLKEMSQDRKFSISKLIKILSSEKEEDCKTIALYIAESLEKKIFNVTRLKPKLEVVRNFI